MMGASMDAEAIIAGMRWVLLVGAGLQLLMATVLFPTIRRRLLEPMLRFADAQRQPVPAMLRSMAFWRSTAAVMTLVPSTLWWVLGTPAGLRAVQQVLTGLP
jgi:hypothetical protein